jgi:outer membrane autotransporter protein
VIDPAQRYAPKPPAIPVEPVFGDQAPLTPGREFAVEPLWNLRTDVSYVSTSDAATGWTFDGQASTVTLGIDRSLTQSLVAGMSLSVATNHTDEFHGISRVESIGLTVSPYVGFRLRPEWTLNASIGFGWTDNDHQVGPLSASYDSWQYSGSLSATGHYPLGGIVLRPKLSVFYSRTASDAHDIGGTPRGVRSICPCRVAHPTSAWRTPPSR